MPLQVPSIDDRRHADLVRDTLARVPVHTPEWTNLSESDPGVTLVELFAFLTESLLYRANRVPEVSKAKFLRLLGVPLAAATPAQGMAVFSGARLDSAVPVLPAGTEVRAGAVPFRTRSAIDVLPVESRAFVKHRVQLDPQDEAYYQLLYEAVDPLASAPKLATYETRELDGTRSVALSEETVDGALWVALLGPAKRDPAEVARALAGKSLSLGLVPDVDLAPREVGSVGQGAVDGEVSELVRYALPRRVDAKPGQAPQGAQTAQATYAPLLPTRADNVLRGPGIVELPLPADEQDLFNWTQLDPLEAGVGDFPPALEDVALASRIVTWVRVAPPRSAGARMRWVGVNAAMLDQRVAISNEVLGEGDGQPDQLLRLSRSGVVTESARIQVIESGVTPPRTWGLVDDLMAAGPEVVLDPTQASRRPNEVCLVDAEAGTVRFGDGLRGRRPPQGSRIVAHYDVCEGRAGNVPAGAISSGPALPPGVRVRNPLPTWGGADAEDAGTGEKRVASFIRHRDRLVTTDDFRDITQRTPGVDLARVEVLSAYHPDLGDSQPGDAPGVVTLMLVPRHDPRQPDAPLPDGAFIDAVCRHLEPRRLVTTELVLRGPQYVPMWLSVGITVAGGHSVPEVRDAVKARLRAMLAPTRADGLTDLPGRESGWPLGTAVNPKELWAEAARVPGVLRINGVNLADADGIAILDEQPLRGLKLPRLLGLSVEAGDPVSISTLRGQGPGDGTGFDQTGNGLEHVVPVPTVPREC
ncbi:MAG: putative baseplate assembly protein [Burkholderiales bacterium]|nr:putative baseplate assembly protein [Burkholderiales bacterium]MBH2015759.1 putative baseplate assembly protein [Burkholderiales bacterium]